jgi:sterol desaturase/sphingolipid hydroxylase (fatty acid hydroxylase superfamily)
MIAGSIGWLAGLLVASLAEYWVHVLMHRKVLLSRTHFNHHRDPAGETWAKQFAYYVLGGVPVVLPIAGLVWWAGAADGALGFVAGGLVWAAWVAYAHTLQHTRPELVFWMRHPVHFLHHEYETGRHNFGLSVDWWDRAFGTYRPMPFVYAPRPRWWGLRLAGIPWV